jgi:hypothetical protein
MAIGRLVSSPITDKVVNSIVTSVGASWRWILALFDLVKAFMKYALRPVSVR